MTKAAHSAAFFKDIMDIKIMSFNLRCLDDGAGNSVFERAPRALATIKEETPDLIGLQECRKVWEEHIEKGLLGEYDMLLKYRNLTVDREASPILWKKDRFALIDSGYFWLSDTPSLESRGWDEIGCFRMCVYVILEDLRSKTRFCFMNTHFGFGADCHKKSAELILSQKKKISSYQTVLVGDFNMGFDDAAYNVLTDRMYDVNMQTARDENPTYHHYGRADKMRHIDYCFVDKSIKPLDYYAIYRTFEGKYSSDHYPIIAKIEI